MVTNLPVPRRIQLLRDEKGSTWIIPADEGTTRTQDTQEVAVWWSRPKGAPEVLLLRQENHTGKNADLIMLTLGQLYDLIDVANQAVESA